MHIKPNLQPLKINFQSLPIQPNFIFVVSPCGGVIQEYRIYWNSRGKSPAESCIY